jgi:hypothetical protein
MLTDQPAATGNSRKTKALAKFNDLLLRTTTLNRANASGFTQWQNDVKTAIRNFFDVSHQHLASFSAIRYSPRVIYSGGGSDYDTPFHRGVSNAQGLLKSIITEIQEYWPDDEARATADSVRTATQDSQIINSMPAEKSAPKKREAPKTKSKNGKSVFIIHGHDDLIKEKVASFLKKIGLKPIILHEKPNKGKTIIEKIEANNKVAFAVALWTPDDKGKKSKTQRLVGRARQNVIFETGYFIGKLGRRHVVVLYKKGTDIPSDYNGILYLAVP